MLAARGAVTMGLAVLAVACGDEPLVFPGWTISIPEDTLVREYEGVALQDRSERIEFARDLVLRGAFGRGLYNPRDVTAGRDGTIYVLDSGNLRVVAFDESGAALYEAGRAGQGPGELQRPVGFGADGDTVLVSDYRNSRLSFYGPDGAVLADQRLADPWWAVRMLGVDAGLVAIVAPPIPFPAGRVPWKVGLFTPQGVELALLIELQASAKAYVESADIIGRLPMVVANPRGEIALDGTVYVTAADEYQVVAIAPSGRMLWALRVGWEVEVLTEERKQEIIAARPPAMASELAGARYTWPSRFAAIENIEVDGAGNLYVFPYSYRTPRTQADDDNPVAVDVFASDGELLLRGLAPLESWQAAYGDHVFRIEDDPDSGERVVARYRMIGGPRRAGAP